ncbi:MAG: VOC family protein [Vicinamibacterales bacterium]
MTTDTRTRAHVIWYELMTTDSQAALAFYSALFGWTGKPTPGVSGPYTILSAGDVGLGGMMDLPKAALAGGAKPGWLMYLGVSDIDDYTARVKAAGGQVLMTPTEIPTVGRFSVVTDPQGAAFIMMTPVSREPMPVVPDRTPGHVGWRELVTKDGTAAFEFYRTMFGWEKTGEYDMGAMGTYHLFTTGGAKGASEGGMMSMAPGMPGPAWTYYVNVDALDAAVARAREAGGTIVNEAIQVPTGEWIAHLVDPQGAMVGLLAPKR